MDRLERLVHGHYVQIKMSKQAREKTWKQGQDRMEADRKRRSQKRIKNMNKIDALEDRGGTVLPPKIKL